MKWFKRAAALFAAAALFLGMVPKTQAVSASSAIVMDALTGRVLYEHNADKRSLIASTTKIMTGYLICRDMDLDETVTVPAEAVGVEGASMYLQPNEELTVRDLVYGLMLQSGNDAAVALAILAGGTVEGFVAQMNEEAQVLGLENTHFENPNGLDGETHYSTARDLAVLAAKAMECEAFAEIVGTKTVNTAGRSMSNHNKLLWQLEGAEGVKTGFTKAAGRALVSSVQYEGRRFIIVTLNAPDDWNDHKALAQEAKEAYTMTELIGAGETAASAEVWNRHISTLDLVAEEAITFPLLPGEEVKTRIIAPDYVYGQVDAGEVGGIAEFYVSDKKIGETELRWSGSVS